MKMQVIDLTVPEERLEDTFMVDIQRETLADGKTQFKVVDNDRVYIITTSEEAAMSCYHERVNEKTKRM